MGALALFGAALALLAAPPSPAAPPSLAGVWDGTIGNLPVRVCFNAHEWGMSGGYYYRSRLQAIALEQPDKTKPAFVEGVGTADATTPRWIIETVGKDGLTGRWSQGSRTLPIALTRAELKEDSSPCASMLFQGPRLEGIRTVSKPAVKDAVPYTRLILDHRGHFGEDVTVETFALAEDGAAARAINAELRKALATTGDDSWFGCIRTSWDSGGGLGQANQTLSPHMITKRWLAAIDENGWSCGGAHPDDARTPLLFDRQTGKRVDVLKWFNAKAIKREKFEGDPDFVETLQPAFRKTILTGWMPKNPECRGPVSSQEFWTAELTRTGVVFAPDLAHVEEGCQEDFKVRFANLAPYLTAEGKKEVTALQAEAAAKR